MDEILDRKVHKMKRYYEERRRGRFDELNNAVMNELKE